MNGNLNVVDLFCGAGGLSFGFQEAGYNILTAIDNDPYAIETYSNNIKTSFKPITKSIKNVKTSYLLDYIKMSQGELDLVIGGPPCRGFSMANRQSNNRNNPYNQLIHQYIHFIEDIAPKAFLIENVNGLKIFDKGTIHEYFLKKIKKNNYIVNQFLFSCEDFGIPQKRERLIIVGTRKRKKLNIDLKKEEEIDVQEAIDDLPSLENGNRRDPLPYKKYVNLSQYQKDMRENSNSDIVYNNLVTKNNDLVIERYNHIAQGGNWSDIPIKLMKNYSNIKNCHSSIYHRLRNNKPSITMCNFRKNMIIHPDQNRGLSVREAARLQSFPDDFIFKGGLNSQQQQVANAVPPKLSKLIAIEILKYFNN